MGFYSYSMHIYWIWDLIDKLITLATLVIFNKNPDIKLTFLRQFEQIKKSFDITERNSFFNSKDKDLLLINHFSPSDKIDYRNNSSLLTKLNENSIEQLVLIEKHPVKILLLVILRQLIKKREKKQTISPLAIDHEKMVQIYAFFSKTVYIFIILEDALQCIDQDM